MLQEFKTFIMKGNVLDLAVGVIIGAAFGKIVNSAVNDLIMPVVGLALGKVDFSNLFISLKGGEYATVAAAKAAGAPTLNYGIFLNTTLDFLIMALVIFMIIKAANKVRKTEEPAPAPVPRECPFCKSAVHDEASRCPHCTSQLNATA
ncbi:large conductance mechanosensitive channel protein MscL [Trichlorobacter lovleyi]|jgi:large conductance mechanosensitive channel protein|uniref:Large-conductance mechanosensitive channel n=1 Tax=Trichlorobacter lovleyi (strain ATCC BAA-1151 / DSM 17278 / SZ) TaxID=398767 RepID=MSCL_TRIL1|nr:large conductance mechanosensitive channel protein MscL [Trichlorobacter lovleyi]B3EA78.1 RecName: Full=Large-conductance mechanosensitive channel [Trichlorobacter lovleyi SZ]ACD93906.1 large conductance mechanosensitive channel protein [Trichlorobacter lovleyi SZ]